MSGYAFEMPAINVADFNSFLNIATIYEFTMLTDGNAHKIDAVVTGVSKSIVVCRVAILNHNRVGTIDRKCKISDPRNGVVKCGSEQSAVGSENLYKRSKNRTVDVHSVK